MTVDQLPLQPPAGRDHDEATDRRRHRDRDQTASRRRARKRAEHRSLDAHEPVMATAAIGKDDVRASPFDGSVTDPQEPVARRLGWREWGLKAGWIRRANPHYASAVGLEDLQRTRSGRAADVVAAAAAHARKTERQPAPVCRPMDENGAGLFCA